MLLKRLFKYRIIQPDCPDGKVAAPLLTRYFLFRAAESFAIFLHHFHRSDVDELHDHPWTFITFLLSSGYWEHVPVECLKPEDYYGKLTKSSVIGVVRLWRHRFSLLYRPATYQHFVEIEKPTWTLVFRFKRVREWGFIKNGIWTHWRRFEDLKSRSICEEVTDATN